MNLSFFKTKFAKNTSWIIFGQIYKMVASLFIGMVSARYLGPSNYGLINYASSISLLFYSFCSLGIENIIINELIRDPGNSGELCGSAIGMRLLFSSISIICIISISSFLNPDEPTTVLVTAIYSLTLLLQSFNTLESWFQSKLRSKITTLISSVSFTCAAIYKIILLITKKNILWFVSVNVLEYFIIAALLIYSYWKSNNHISPLKFKLKTGKYLLSKSYHFILSGLMVAIYGQTDKIMLKAMMDEASVGFYSAANTIATLWVFIISAIISSARPLILENFEKDKEKYEHSLIRLYSVIVYMSFTVALCISLFAKIIIYILYGKSYMLATGTLRIITWSTAFSYLGVARSIWLVPNKMEKYEKYIAASGAICNIILNATLIPTRGAEGAAFATLLTQFFTNFIIGFGIKDIRPNNYIMLKGLALPFKKIQEYVEKTR